jgi:hypothetical protein
MVECAAALAIDRSEGDSLGCLLSPERPLTGRSADAHAAAADARDRELRLSDVAGGEATEGNGDALHPALLVQPAAISISISDGCVAF